MGEDGSVSEKVTHLKMGDRRVVQWAIDEMAVDPMHAECSSNGSKVVVHVRNMYAKGVRMIRERRED